jgi:hypothetical protein
VPAVTIPPKTMSFTICPTSRDEKKIDPRLPNHGDEYIMYCRMNQGLLLIISLIID